MNTRRLRALGRFELLLFWRNRTAMVTALALPVIAVGFIATTAGDHTVGPVPVTAMVGVTLLLIVYYNLVSVYVARREDRVLKRLRAGEATDAEILLGAALPAVAIAAGQAVVLLAAGAVLLHLPVPVNLPVLVAGVLAGIAMFALLAAASSAFTRTVELAQISTLPVTMACLAGSGLLVPVEAMPAPLAAIARFLPLTPVVDLMRLGWVGTTGVAEPADFAGVFGAAVVPAAVLAAWILLGAAGVRRLFRWEPRH